MNAVDLMKLALLQAESVKGSTAPNPAVGAVIVKDNVVIGKGATAPVGGPHAEVRAVEDAGIEDCNGAELYVTLEPCSHFGKTPPCSELVVKAQFKKVYVAVLDPNPAVAGRGIKQIEDAGIEVEVGLLEKEARRLNEDFFHFILEKTPFITVKLAMTLDGMIADYADGSKWITSASSRKKVHEIRVRNSAIAVGSGTLRADDPKLNVRHVEGGDPIRIAFSSYAETGKGLYFRNMAKEVRTILVVSDGSPKRQTIADDGVELWFTGTTDFGETMHRFMKMAGEAEIDSILFEGGARLIRSLIEEKLVHRFTLFYGPKILGGGKSGIALSQGLKLTEAIALDDIEFEQFESDWMVSGLASWGDEE